MVSYPEMCKNSYIAQTLSFFLQNHCLMMMQKAGNWGGDENSLPCKHLFNVFRVSPPA
jgi:hypothetical protein